MQTHSSQVATLNVYRDGQKMTMRRVHVAKGGKPSLATKDVADAASRLSGTFDREFKDEGVSGGILAADRPSEAGWNICSSQHVRSVASALTLRWKSCLF